MKFILMVEEDGYQIRFWDEILEQIGENVASSWDKKQLHTTLKNKGMNIKKEELYKAIDMIENQDKSFVVLKSYHKTNVDLDTFLNDEFRIDDSV